MTAVRRFGCEGGFTLFVDEVEIEVLAGVGGNGHVSFRKEKYVPNGGPDGGDGGRGGSIYFKVDPGMTTLVDFRYKRKFKATPGEHGGKKNKHGASGEDLHILVPAGTVVRDIDKNLVLADLIEGEWLAAKGGRGGRGNARFVSAVHQAPRMAENGEPGQIKRLTLELRILADVALVGMPNAGKSSLVRRVTDAKPKVADYPFTTLQPVLGVVMRGEGRNFVIADIPGLIEGAHEGVGLGDTHLRHLSRARLLLHVVDVGSEGKDPIADFEAVVRELTLYQTDLGQKVALIVANKMDLPYAKEGLATLKEAIKAQGLPIYPISTVTGEGIPELLNEVEKRLSQLPVPEPLAVSYAEEVDPELYEIEVEGSGFRVRGQAVERRVAMTNLNNQEAARRLGVYFRRKGIEDALRNQGADEETPIYVGHAEFQLTEGEWVTDEKR